MTKSFIEIMNYQIFTNSLSSISIFDCEKKIFNTINPHSYCIAKKDEAFRQALKSSTILLPDGIGIVLAARILKSIKIKKIAGADIHIHLLNKANENNSRVFYLGASVNTLSKITCRVKKEFPNINISTYSPPYKPEFTEEDNTLMLNTINSFNPDILFIGMTAPKQEKWVYQNKEKINAKVITSIGAVFDFYAGTVKRASPFWIKMGLEWLPRFIKEPKRLWKRVFISNPLFVLDVFKYKFGLSKLK